MYLICLELNVNFCTSYSTIVLINFICAVGLKYLNVPLDLILQKTVSQLKAELEKGPQETAVYTQQIHELQSSLNNLQQQNQVTSFLQ